MLPGDSHVDGRSRRIHLVRRQARALAFSDHSRAHPFASLRPRGIRGRARLQDRRRDGDLQASRPHRAPVQLGAYLHDENPLRPGDAHRSPEGSGARQPARVLLHPADRFLRLGEDGGVPDRRDRARRRRRVALGRLSRSGSARERNTRQDLVLCAPPRQRDHGSRQDGRDLSELDPREPGGDPARLRRGPAPRRGRFRRRGIGRESLHRQGRQDPRAGADFRLERDHARLGHHSRGRPGL